MTQGVSTMDLHFTEKPWNMQLCSQIDDTKKKIKMKMYSYFEALMLD